jgi:hypothetical protein
MQFAFGENAENTGGVLRGVVHYILIFTLMFSHWSYAGQASKVENPFEAEINEILNKSSEPQKNKTVDSTIIVGPYFKNSSIRIESMSSIEGDLYYSTIKEVREERNLPENEAFERVFDLRGVEHLKPVVDLKQHPDFFQVVQERYEAKLQEHYDNQRQKHLQMEAAKSLNDSKEKMKSFVSYTIRWGTTVMFFIAIVNPSNLSLVAIAGTSLLATYMYNNLMPLYESWLDKGGALARQVPLKALELTGTITGKMPLLRVTKPVVDWATRNYQENIMNKNYAKVVGQLSTAFIISAAWVAIYTIAMNLSSIGFAASAAASGKIFAAGSLIDPSTWQFMPERMNLTNFLAALESDFAKFQWSSMWSLLGNEPFLKKAFLLTAFAETWTIYRMKYRSMVADQSKANDLGRLTGIFFAFMGPVVHKSSQVLNGTANDFWSLTGVFVVGAVGLAGLAYVFGDGPGYTKKIGQFINATRANTRRMIDGSYRGFQAAKAYSLKGIEKLEKSGKAVMASLFLGSMELNHRREIMQSRLPQERWSEAPTLLLDRLSRSLDANTKLSCKQAF